MHFVPANAEALPLASATVDLVFLSMVYHHLRAEAAVVEIARVVRRGGAVFVRTPTLDTIAAFEYIRFVPEALAFDRARMPHRVVIEATFATVGLHPAAHRVMMHRFAGSHAEYYAKVSQRALSLLAAIPDDAFARGLGRLRMVLSRDGGRADLRADRAAHPGAEPEASSRPRPARMLVSLGRFLLGGPR
jgi:SAM-dependent methyltransferase